MDLLKITSRGHFALQCLCEMRRGFHSSANMLNAVNKLGRRVRPSTSYFGKATHPPSSLLMSSSFAHHSRSLIPVQRLVLYSTETEVTKGQKQEVSSHTSESVVSSTDEADAKSETGSGESTSEESTEVLSKAQTDDHLPSEQTESDWESKLDKLYKVIELEVLAYEPSVLDSYQWFVLTAASHLGIQVGKCWSPQNNKKFRFQLLKSAFVHKKHVVHYEIRTHHRFLTFHKLTSSTADTFLEYIERNLPEGVGLKVTRVEAKPLPEYLLKQPHRQ